MEKKIWLADLILAIVIILMLILPIKANAKTAEEYYPNAGIITELDEENDIVYFTDFSGNIWSFSGIEDLLEGDIVAVIMADVGKTNYIYDDEVVAVRYIGYAY